jgi:formylglycine-generating enzyme
LHLGWLKRQAFAVHVEDAAREFGNALNPTSSSCHPDHVILFCHPERSEGSMHFAARPGETKPEVASGATMCTQAECRNARASDPRPHPSTSLEPALARIPEGWFTMGSEAGQDNERPVHRVWIDAFLLAATQVTNEEYERFLSATGAAAPPFWSDVHFNHPQQPVVAVSWFEATSYCNWLSNQTARSYRLPSEAEWERAARGGVEGQPFPWGNEPPQSLPNYATRWQTGPEPVALYDPNAFGLFNMCDNVHEWCSDWYQTDYYSVSPDRNPRGPDTGVRRASRGGSWRHHIKVSRCAARSSIPPHFQYADYGFRVACNAT